MLTRSQKRFDLFTAAIFAACLTLLLMLVGGCVPPVPPQPAPPPRSVQVTIRGTDGHTPAGTYAVVRTDAPVDHPCDQRLAEDRVGCPLGPDVPVGDPNVNTPENPVAGGNLIITAPGYLDFNRRLGLTGLDQPIEDAILRVLPPRPSLPRIVPGGPNGTFKLSNGSPFTVIGATDFNVLARFMRGESVDAVLAQRAAVGFNVLRVFTAFDICYQGVSNGQPCQEIGRLIPREHADYDAKVAAFLRAAAARNLWVELVAFTGPYGAMFGNDDEMVAHWDRLRGITETNVILELVNEDDQPANHLSDAVKARLLEPTGITASHGSNGTNGLNAEPPVRPGWSYETMHFNNVSEWPRKVGHNCMEDGTWVSGLPCVGNETTRAPDYFNNIEAAYDTARACALLSAGCTFHSVHGKNSTTWTGDELENAKAWANGGRGLMLKCQVGAYQNLGQSDVYSRIYQRGNDPDCIAPIRWFEQ